MKKGSLFAFSFCFGIYMLACLRLVAQPVEVNVLVPFTSKYNTTISGYNLEAPLRPSWQNTSFRDSVKRLNPKLIRYPGGSVSQYWNWQKGLPIADTAWVNYGGSLMNFDSLATVSMAPYTIDELRQVLISVQANAVFVLNVLTGNITDQMNMLRHADALGIPIGYIELGDAMYREEIDFVQRFPNAGAYAREMTLWCDSIKSAFPSARVGINMTLDSDTLLNGHPNSQRSKTWNDSIHALYPYRDAATLQLAIPHLDTSATPDASVVLASAVVGWHDKVYHTISQIDTSFDIWITSMHVDEYPTTSHIGGTWLHGLFSGAMYLQLASHPEVSMVLYHQITGDASTACLSSFTTFGDTLSNNLTATGNVMRLLQGLESMVSYHDTVSMHRNHKITSTQGIEYPGLLVQFYSDKQIAPYYTFNMDYRGVFMNLSSDTLKLNLTMDVACPNMIHQLIEGISSEFLLNRDQISDSLIYSDRIEGELGIPYYLNPYSVHVLKFDIIENTNPDEDLSQQITFWPNPAGDLLNISFPGMRADYHVYNLLGSLCQSGTIEIEKPYIDLSGLMGGAYILHLKSDKVQGAYKVLKK